MNRAIVLVPAPDYHEVWDWAFDVEAEVLRRGGFAVEARPWNAVGEIDADIVLPLVAWGYHLDQAAWRALLDLLDENGTVVANPISVLRWNSDKKYLVELGRAGVPVIPTRFVGTLDGAALDEARRDFGGELVVKPPISAAADGTHRVGPGETVPESARGRPMMIQPFLPAIMSEGEYSLLMFDGTFSHAIVKRAKAGDYRVQPHLGGSEKACAPPEGSIAVASAALACAPEKPAYARVDMVRGADGELKVIELELIEPSLWLEHAPDKGASFAAAIARRLRP